MSLYTNRKNLSRRNTGTRNIHPVNIPFAEIPLGEINGCKIFHLKITDHGNEYVNLYVYLHAQLRIVYCHSLELQ